MVLERIYRPQTGLASYIEAGYSPPYHVLAPSCSPYDDTPLEQCLRELGAKLVIEVPESIAGLVKSLAEKGGSAALTAKLINALEDNVALRKTIAELKRRMIRETEAAKSLLAAQAWRAVTRLPPRVVDSNSLRHRRAGRLLG